MDQTRQSFTEWKLLSDGLDNLMEILFATSKGACVVARRNREIERVIAEGGTLSKADIRPSTK